MERIDRRIFLAQAGAAAGGMALSGRSRADQTPKRGANNRIRVAVVGIHGQGKYHIKALSALPDVDVVALCDVDEPLLNKLSATQERTVAGVKVARYADIRKLLDDKSIDAVTIATPNHWHTLAGIWTMQGGKDAYVEKPCSHNIWEGRQLVKAARKYNRLCQHGTQGRSCPAIEEAVAKLREGIIGEVYMARGLCYKWRDDIGKVKGPQPIPDGVNYDRWLGPAADKPLMRKKLHYDWHWQWDYGNGDLGNQGVHEMDMARWGLGVGLPSKITSMGDQFMFDDDKQVPNTQIAGFHYPDQKKMLVFEVRHWISNYEGSFGGNGSNNVGVIFYGSEGYMTVRYFEYRTYLGKKREPGPANKSRENRFERFAKALRTRNREDLGVDIEEGHVSSALCHLANTSYRLGRTLNFDPQTERYVGDNEANGMLTREYRTPYTVPEIS